MCCLKYENDTYEEAKRQLPDIGQRIQTSYGRGRVVGVNILEKIVHIEVENNGGRVEYTIDEMIAEEMIDVPVL